MNDTILSRVFDHSIIGMAIVTIDGEVVKVNNSLCHLLGCSEKDFNFQQMTHKEDQRKRHQLMTWMLNEKRDSYQVQERYYHKKGHIITGNNTISLLSEKEGTPCFLLQIETESNHINSTYKMIAEHASDMIAVHKPDRTVRYVSPAITNLLGYTQQEMTGELPVDYWHPEDQQQFYQSLQDLTLRDTVDRLCYRFRHKDGHYVWLESTYKGIRDASTNELLEIVSTSRDITDRKVAEIELEHSEERFRNLVVHSPEMICVHNGDVYLYINPSGAKLLGANSPEEIIGQSIWKFFLKEEREQRTNNIERLLHETGYVSIIRHQLKQLDGTIVDIDVTATGIIYNEERAIQAVVKDITERKKIDTIIRKSEKLSMVGQLAAGVAHEVRNPLTAIKGFLQLSTCSKVYNEDHTNIMLSELNRVEAIIYEFLTLAKPHQLSTYQKRDVRALLQQVTTLLNTQALMQNVEIIPDLNEVPLVTCEEDQLKQVFINLLQNAIEALPAQGKVTITLAQLDDQYIQIQFIDNGCGIPHDRLNKLGEPFYSTKEKGTGLGLMVSYKIIENHQGSIHFSSDVNQGTTVTVILPI